MRNFPEVLASLVLNASTGRRSRTVSRRHQAPKKRRPILMSGWCRAPILHLQAGFAAASSPLEYCQEDFPPRHAFRHKRRSFLSKAFDLLSLACRRSIASANVASGFTASRFTRIAPNDTPGMEHREGSEWRRSYCQRYRFTKHCHLLVAGAAEFSGKSSLAVQSVVRRNRLSHYRLHARSSSRCCFRAAMQPAKWHYYDFVTEAQEV